MATPFLMPKLGLTMEEGMIAEWLADDGTTITIGSPVLRIETDKTETDVEATEGGVLHIVGQTGETFACGEQIGWLLEPGEKPPVSAAAASTAAASATPAAAGDLPVSATVASPAADLAVPAGRRFVSPNARRLAAERGIDLARVVGTGPGGRIVSADLDTPLQPLATVPAPGSPAVAHAGASVAATFAGRALADLLGIDISTVPTDPRTGRVGRDEVAAHVRSLLGADQQTAAAAPAPQAPSLTPALQAPSSVVPLKGMRGTIASRMHESLQSMAQLSLFMDADLDAVVADRDARKAIGAAPSYTDYVIAAVAQALHEHPHINAQITNDGIALLPEVHVGMAVALDNGLVVPVVQNTASRDLANLAAETTRLAEAARSGSLKLPELEGGTFSVSTLGMYGVDGFTPIVNPPNAAILGVGRLRQDLVLNDDGTAGSITRSTLSLTWDHRVFDGAPAAAFTKRITELLQDPAALDAV